MSQASHEFKGSVDFNQYELRNPTFQNLVTPPISPVLGQIYNNSLLSTPYYWNGTEWTPFGLRPVHKKYADDTTMFADQSLQIRNYIYHQEDIDTYYEYLGTTNGDITDYNPIGGSGLVTASTGLTKVGNDIQLGKDLFDLGFIRLIDFNDLNTELLSISSIPYEDAMTNPSGYLDGHNFEQSFEKPTIGQASAKISSVTSHLYDNPNYSGKNDIKSSIISQSYSNGANALLRVDADVPDDSGELQTSYAFIQASYQYTYLDQYPDRVNYDANIRLERYISPSTIANGGQQWLKFEIGYNDNSLTEDYRIHFRDTINYKGVEYYEDYEHNFTARSLVTKQYVDGEISNIPEITASGGLTKNVNDIYLGNNGVGVIDVSDASIFLNGFKTEFLFQDFVNSEETSSFFQLNGSQFGGGTSYREFIGFDEFTGSFEVQSNAGGVNINLSKSINDDVQDFSFNEDNTIILTDDINEKGVVYGGDYEINFTPRSLVTQQYVTSEISANAYIHPSFTAFVLDANGAQVIDEITTTTEGHVSNITLRNLTLADLGYTGATDANNYSHPAYTPQNPTLSGALVLSSIETDSIGSVVSITTRTLSASDIDAININQLNVASGVATLDGSGTLLESQIPASLLGGVKYIDNWNAATNTPTLPDPTTVKGNYYIITTGGTVTGAEYDDGSITFNQKDWVISNGVVWKKVDNTDSVASVFGRQGNILALVGDYEDFYVRHDANNQGLTVTQQNNARTNINAQSVITGGATSITDSNLTFNRALISNGSGKVAVSAITSTELSRLDGVTSNIQTQLNAKIEENDIITLSGDITGSGRTSIATTISNNAVTTTKVLNKNITYAKIQDVSANRILGQTASTGTVRELTAAEVRNIINVSDGANNYTHPSYTTRNVTLSGATVLASFSSDNIGSITGITTRALTPADIGAQPSGNYVTLDTAQTITGEKTIDTTFRFLSEQKLQFDEETGLGIKYTFETGEFGGLHLTGYGGSSDQFSYPLMSYGVGEGNTYVSVRSDRFYIQNQRSGVPTFGSGIVQALIVDEWNEVKRLDLSDLLDELGAQPAGNYVTIDTAQSITGYKTFVNGAQFEDSTSFGDEIELQSGANFNDATLFLRGTSIIRFENLPVNSSGDILTIYDDGFGDFFVGRRTPSQVLSDIGAQPAGSYASASHTHPWSQITSTPTTLAGYGITDAVPSGRTIAISTGTGITGGVTQSLASNRTWNLAFDTVWGDARYQAAGSYDNYQSWNLRTNNVQRTTIQSGGILDLVAGSNVSISYSAGGIVTISSSFTNTNNYVNSVSFSTSTGILTLGRLGLSSLTVDLDGRYSLTTHNHTLDSLSNVTITSNSNGEILRWNGTAWINNTLAQAGIQPAGSYGLTTADITAVSLTTTTLTLTRSAGNLTAAIPTWNQNTTGNAATATRLQTARTINGTSFNGTANITTANWGTARTLTIGNTGKSVNGSANVSWSLAEIGAAPANSETLATVLARGNTSSDEILLTAVGTNTTIGADDIKISGYGLMVNRTSSYFTNNNSSGKFIFGFGGAHNVGHALTVDNVGIHTNRLESISGELNIQPSGGSTTGVNVTNNVNFYSASNTGVLRNTVTNGSIVLAGGNTTASGANLRLSGPSGDNDFRFRIGGTDVWEITSTGIFQSNGAQTIRTSTGNLTLATNGGAGDIILAPNGAGNIDLRVEGDGIIFSDSLVSDLSTRTVQSWDSQSTVSGNVRLELRLGRGGSDKNVFWQTYYGISPYTTEAILGLNPDGGNVVIGSTVDNGEKLQVEGNITTRKAILSNQENTDIDSTGTEVAAQISSTTYTAVFFDYVIKNGTNMRAGTVYATHDGTNVVFTETSTADLGNTSGVEFEVDLSGGNVRLLMSTTSDNWSVKTLVRGL